MAAALFLVVGILACFCGETVPAIPLIIGLPCLAGALIIQVTEGNRH